MLALSADGRAAYLLQGDKGLLDVIDLPAPGNPKAVYRLDLGPSDRWRWPPPRGHRCWPWYAVATSSSSTPALRCGRHERAAGAPARGPAGTAGRSDVSPDGKLLAVATEEGNRVLLLDLVPRGRVPLVGSLSVVPDVRESVLVDIAFSPSGDTLWVLSGEPLEADPSAPNLRSSTPSGWPAIPRPWPSSKWRVSFASKARSSRRASAFHALCRWPVGAPSGCLPSGPPCSSPRPRDPRAPGVRPPCFASERTTQPPSPFRAPGRFGWPDVTSDGRWLLVPSLAADGSVRLLATAIDGRPSPAPRPTDVVGPDPGASPGRAGPLPQFRIQP